jgi:hypothetical protein
LKHQLQKPMKANTESMPYARGSFAASTGKPRAANPFLVGSAAWNDWDDGWNNHTNTDWQAKEAQVRELLASGNLQEWTIQQMKG